MTAGKIGTLWPCVIIHHYIEGAHAQLTWAWPICVVAMEVVNNNLQRLPVKAVSISAVHAVRNDDASSEGKHLHSLQNKSESICGSPAGSFWQLKVSWKLKL